MSTTVSINPTVLAHIARVGQTVFYRDELHYVYQVEGASFYAFMDGDAITVDLDFPYAAWLEEPRYMIIPEGCKVGEGFGVELAASALMRYVKS